VLDLIAADRERLVALSEDECRTLIDRVAAHIDRVAARSEKLIVLVECNNKQSQSTIAKATESVDRVFDRIQAKQAWLPGR
jgi:hypothetical protein